MFIFWKGFQLGHTQGLKRLMKLICLVVCGKTFYRAWILSYSESRTETHFTMHLQTIFPVMNFAIEVLVSRLVS